MKSKREIIIEEAKKIIAKYGLKKTTMDDIAQSLKMGKASLYYYFKSKDEIFSEIITRDSQKYKDKLRDVLTEAKSPADKLRMYILTRIMFLSKLKEYFAALTDEYYENYTFIKEIRSDFYSFEIITLKDIIKEGMQENFFSPLSLAASASSVSIAIKGLEIALLLEHSSFDMKKETTNMTKLIIKGLEKR